MAIILVLEDSESRIKCFKRGLSGHSVYFTDTPSEALRLLQTTQFNQIFFDHDLYDVDRYPHAGLTGVETTSEAATWLPGNRLCEIIIHSLNVVGAQNMEADCIAAGCSNVRRIPYLDLPFYKNSNKF